MSVSIETINCGDSLKAENLDTLYARLLVSLANGEQVALDCSELDYIDTPALQMLAAFSQEAALHGHTVTWDKTSVVFRKNVRLLGLEHDLQTIDTKSIASEEQLTQGWDISFSPHINFFHESIKDPLQIFAELASMGESIVDVDNRPLPLFSEIEPDNSYLSWQLTLKGDAVKEDIETIFASVVQYCELAIKRIVTDVDPETEITPQSQSQSALAQPKNKEIETLLRVNDEKLDRLTGLMDQMLVKQHKVSQQFNDQMLPQTNDAIVELENSTREMQEAVMQLRYLPMGSIFNGLAEYVTGLVTKLSKKIEFKLSGEQIELDVAALAIVDESLRILLHGCVQNSIVTSDLRIAAEKPEIASLQLIVFQRDTSIIIELTDDGCGEIEELETGLDTVRNKITTLGGSIDIKSQIDEQTTYSIQLPMHLGVIDGQLIRVAGETYILPVSLVIESLAININDISDIAGKGELYRWQDDYIPIIRLARLLSTQPTTTELGQGLLVVVNIDDQKVGLLLDDVLEQQRIYSQTLAIHYKNIAGVSAAAIMNDASVALILDLPNLIGHYRNSTSTHFDSANSGNKVA